MPRASLRTPALAAVLADTPYDINGVAGAPWADPAAPESAGFAGIWVTSITGLDAATSTRTVTALAGGGGVPAQARNDARTMVITCFLAATSAKSLAYGIGWLDAVLHDDCAGACTGSLLCMLAAPPDCDTATQGAADACWRDLARTMHDVTCVAGPSVHQESDLGGCQGGAAGAAVDFTLVASRPHVYRYPQTVADAVPFGAPVTSGCQITWIPLGPGTSRPGFRPRRLSCPPIPVCDPPATCADDPAAPLPQLPAAVPAPMCTTARPPSAWSATTATPGLIPRWLDSVPVITVTSGPAVMRRLSIRLHASPLLTTITDPREIDPCTALAEINVSYLPRDATLMIDGRTQDAYLICPGGAHADASHLLSGPAGTAFDWPVLVCGAHLTVLALADADWYDPAAAITVELAARADVS